MTDEPTPTPPRAHVARPTAGKATAPDGYMLAGDVMRRLGITRHGLQALRDHQGRLHPLQKAKGAYGFYPIAEVEALATELAEHDLAVVMGASHPLLLTFRQGSRYDIHALNAVLASFGWPFTPYETRLAWYGKNPRIDWVIQYGAVVLGYLNLMPLYPDILEQMLGGHRRGWGLRPAHLHAYEGGQTYDAFFGIAVRAVPFREQYAAFLLSQWERALAHMATQEGILFREIYGMTDEDEGRRIAATIHAERLPNLPTDQRLDEGRAAPGERYALHMARYEGEGRVSRLVARYRRTLAGEAASPTEGEDAGEGEVLRADAALLPALTSAATALLTASGVGLPTEHAEIVVWRRLAALLAVSEQMTAEQRGQFARLAQLSGGREAQP